MKNILHFQINLGNYILTAQPLFLRIACGKIGACGKRFASQLKILPNFSLIFWGSLCLQ